MVFVVVTEEWYGCTDDEMQLETMTVEVDVEVGADNKAYIIVTEEEFGGQIIGYNNLYSAEQHISDNDKLDTHIIEISIND